MKITTKIVGTSKGIPYREDRLNEVLDLEDRIKSRIGIHPSIELVNSNPQEYNPKDIAIRFGDNPFFFFIFLAAGQEKAADYLSDCYDRGIGTNLDKTTDFHIELPIVIGAKLGDEECIATMKAGGELKDKRLEPCATACAASILRNKNELGAHATFKDIIGRAKLLDEQIKQLSSESYFETMVDQRDDGIVVCGAWLGYVEDVEVIVTGDAPDSCCVIM